jgi:hypothetical protein
LARSPQRVPRIRSGRIVVFGCDVVPDAVRARLLTGVAPQDVQLDRFPEHPRRAHLPRRYFGMPELEAGRRADELLEVFDFDQPSC